MGLFQKSECESQHRSYPFYFFPVLLTVDIFLFAFILNSESFLPLLPKPRTDFIKRSGGTFLWNNITHCTRCLDSLGCFIKLKDVKKLFFPKLKSRYAHGSMTSRRVATSVPVAKSILYPGAWPVKLSRRKLTSKKIIFSRFFLVFTATTAWQRRLLHPRISPLQKERQYSRDWFLIHLWKEKCSDYCCIKCSRTL